MRTENYKVREIVELRIPNENTTKKGIIVDIIFIGKLNYLGDNYYFAIVYTNNMLYKAYYTESICEQGNDCDLEYSYSNLANCKVLTKCSIPEYDKLLGQDTIYNKEYNIGDIVDITIPDVGSIKGVILHVYKENNTNDKSKGDNGEDITRQFVTYHCAVYANNCIYEIRFSTHSIKHFYCGFPPYDGEIIGRETKISEYYTQFNPKYVRTIAENCTIPKYDELLK